MTKDFWLDWLNEEEGEEMQERIITEDELKKLEELAAQTTSPPWIISPKRGHLEIRTTPSQEDMTYKDAAYVGALIAAAPRLIKRIREQEQIEERLVDENIFLRNRLEFHLTKKNVAAAEEAAKETGNESVLHK